MEIVRFQSLYLQLKNATQVFWKVLKKVLKTFRTLSDCLIKTKPTDLSNGGPFKNSLVPFRRRTYALSAGFKMKFLRKQNFPELSQKQTKILS